MAAALVPAHLHLRAETSRTPRATRDAAEAPKVNRPPLPTRCSFCRDFLRAQPQASGRGRQGPRVEIAKERSNTWGFVTRNNAPAAPGEGLLPAQASAPWRHGPRVETAREGLNAWGSATWQNAPGPGMLTAQALPGTAFLRQAKEAALSEWPAYAPWDKVRLGPLEVPPMGVGTWAWGNRLLWDYDPSMDQELQQLFNLVVSKGVNLFDTADSYGTGTLNGRSEELLGQFTREYPGSERARAGVKIATKIAAYPWRLTASQMVSALRGSLRRLGMEKIAIGQLHWSAANYAPLQERALWDGLIAMYEEGLVTCVGVSNYGPQQLQRIHKYLQARGVPLASAQVQFSLLSTGPQQEALKAFCDSQGIRVIAYSPLGLGALTGKYSPDNLPKGPRSLLFKQMLPGLGGLLAAMEEAADTHKKTLPQVAINWCICKGTIPIPGAKTLKQAQENLGALGWKLSPQEVEALEDAALAVRRPMIQNIFQTK